MMVVRAGVFDDGCVQPLTGVWGLPHRQWLQIGNPYGVRGRGWERSRATDMEALTGLGGTRRRGWVRYGVG